MKKIYFCFFLFSLIYSSVRSQGVSSGYVIDSVVIKESRHHGSQFELIFKVDSFDSHGLIRSENVYFDSIFPQNQNQQYRYTNDYFPTCNLRMKKLEIRFQGQMKLFDSIFYQYDFYNRLIGFSELRFEYSKNPIVLYERYDYYTDWDSQNREVLIRGSHQKGSLLDSVKIKTIFDTGGKLIYKWSGYWNLLQGWRINYLNRYEYNSKDSVKTLYKISDSDSSRILYNYDSISGRQNFYYTQKYYNGGWHSSQMDTLTYNAAFEKVRIDKKLPYAQNQWRLDNAVIYTFDNFHNITSKVDKDWESGDSIWYMNDTSSFVFNSNNQIIEEFDNSSSYGGGKSTYFYDSSGKMITNIRVQSSNSTSYIDTTLFSYKKLLHPDAIPDENAFTLFPNPNDGNFNLIYFSSIDEPITIKVHNALGQVVFQETENKTAGYFRMNFTFEKISNGIYFLEFTSTSKRTTKKFLVE